MLKLFELWNRLPTTDALDPLVAGAARYVTNVGLHARAAPPYEAIDEYWLEDAALLPDADEVGARDRRLVGARHLMLAEAVVHVDRGRRHQGIKSMFLLTRRPEMTRDECTSYWREHHVPLVMSTLGDHLVRYTTNVGLPTDFNGWPCECSPYDGVAELWLDLAVDEMFELVDNAAAVLLPDERAFCGTYRMLLADERVNVGAEDGLLPR